MIFDFQGSELKGIEENTIHGTAMKDTKEPNHFIFPLTSVSHLGVPAKSLESLKLIEDLALPWQILANSVTAEREAVRIHT